MAILSDYRKGCIPLQKVFQFGGWKKGDGIYDNKTFDISVDVNGFKFLNRTHSGQDVQRLYSYRDFQINGMKIGSHFIDNSIKVGCTIGYWEQIDAMYEFWARLQFKVGSRIHIISKDGMWTVKQINTCNMILGYSAHDDGNFPVNIIDFKCLAGGYNNLHN